MPLIERRVTVIEYDHTCEDGKKPNPQVVLNKNNYQWKFYGKTITHCPDCGEKLEIPPRPVKKRVSSKR